MGVLKEVVLFPIAPIRYPYKLVKAGVKKAYKTNKDKNYVRNFFNLKEIGINIVEDELNEYQKQFKEKSKEIEEKREKINKLYQDIDKLDEKITKGEEALEKMKSKKGFFGRMFLVFNGKYRSQKKLVEIYKKQKDAIPDAINEEQAKLKAGQKDLKNIQKEIKKFRKNVNAKAREFSRSIKVVTYFKKHRKELEEACYEEEFEDIESEIQEIIDNKGEWPFENTPERYLNYLKMRINKKNSNREQDDNGDPENDPQEGVYFEQEEQEQEEIDDATKLSESEQVRARRNSERFENWQDYFRGTGDFENKLDGDSLEKKEGDVPELPEQIEEGQSTENSTDETIKTKQEEPAPESQEEPKTEEIQETEKAQIQEEIQEPEEIITQQETQNQQEIPTQVESQQTQQSIIRSKMDRNTLNKLNGYMNDEILDAEDLEWLNDDTEQYQGTVEDIIEESKRPFPPLEEQLKEAKRKFEHREESKKQIVGKHLTPEEKAKEIKNAKRREQRAEAKRQEEARKLEEQRKRDVNVQSLLKNREQLIEAIENERNSIIVKEYKKELDRIEKNLEANGESVIPYDVEKSTVVDKRGNDFRESLKVDVGGNPTGNSTPTSGQPVKENDER